MLGVLGIILALILAVAVGYFSAMNPTPVSVHLFPGMPPRAAFVWEIAAYAAMAGCLFSLCFLLWAMLGLQQRCRLLRLRVRELEGKRQPEPPIVAEAPRTALANGVRVSEPASGRAVVTRSDEEPV